MSKRIKEYKIPRINKNVKLADLKDEAIMRGFDAATLPKKKADLLEQLVEGSIHLKLSLDTLKQALESELPGLRVEMKRANDEKEERRAYEVAMKKRQEEERLVHEAAMKKQQEALKKQQEAQKKLHVYSFPSVHSCLLALTEKLVLNGQTRNCNNTNCDPCGLRGMCLYSCEMCNFDVCPHCVDGISTQALVVASRKTEAEGGKPAGIAAVKELLAGTKNPTLEKEAQAAKEKVLAKIAHDRAQQLLRAQQLEQQQKQIEQQQEQLREKRRQETLKRKREEEERAETEECPPSYDQKQFTKAVKEPSEKSKTFKSKLGFTVWCSNGHPSDGWHSREGRPVKEFDTTWKTKKEANLRAKFLFYWKNIWGVHPNEMMGYYGGFETEFGDDDDVKTMSKQGLISLKWHPDDDKEWVVGVVPDVAFEHLDNATMSRHNNDNDDGDDHDEVWYGRHSYF